jgi:hypothetical protein
MEDCRHDHTDQCGLTALMARRRAAEKHDQLSGRAEDRVASAAGKGVAPVTT